LSHESQVENKAFTLFYLL